MRWHAAAEAGAYLERQKIAELVYANADLREQLAAVTTLLLYMASTTQQPVQDKAGAALYTSAAGDQEALINAPRSSRQKETAAELDAEASRG